MVIALTWRVAVEAVEAGVQRLDARSLVDEAQALAAVGAHPDP